jgi:aspartate/methionine/tyrosine aminotransferase
MEILMRKYASKLEKLGTETAFAVSADATAFANRSGKKVYPFHLGDMDINTPPNIIEAANKAMHDGYTGYNPSFGIPALRAVLAEEIGLGRAVHYNSDNACIQPGGKPVIGKFIQAVMNPGDGVLYPNPGYPIYESQINYHGGKPIPYGYIQTDDGFSIDRELVESQIDDTTKIFIYNNFQNPIGAESNEEEMHWVADLAIKHDLWVLSDEAYFNIRYSGKSESIVTIPGMQERTVILHTFSKTYAMTGWRLGAAIGPKPIIDIIGKLSVNDESCTNHFIQYAGIEAIQGDQTNVLNILEILKNRRDTLFNLLNSIDGVHIVKPNTTFYLYPEITEIFHKMGCETYEEFRTKTLEGSGVSFCTREHFGTPLENENKEFIRFAYSGISESNINEGILKLKEFWDQF